jgi:Fe-S cluster assembly iron-binding protein IscA
MAGDVHELSVRFAPDAREELDRMIRENPDLHLTVYIKGPGCGGPTLGIEMREAMETDLVTEQEGITLHIRETAVPYLETARIRLEDTFWGKKLKVKRPGACG